MSVPAQPDPVPTRRPLLRLLGYARPYLWVLAATIAFSLLYAGGLTARAWLLKPLTDDVAVPNLSIEAVLGDSRAEPAELDPAERAAREAAEAATRERIADSLTSILWLFALIVVAMPVLRFARDYTGDWLMTRLGVDLQIDLAHKVTRLPLAHHVREGRGDFVARAHSDTVVANRAQALLFGDFIQDAAQILGAVVMMFVLNWQLSLVTLVAGPPIAIVLSVFGRRVRTASRRRQAQVSEVAQRLLQILSGIKIIKAFHAEAAEREAYARTAQRYFRRSIKVVRNRMYSRSLVELFTQIGVGLILGVGGYALVNNLWGVTPGVLVAYVFIAGMVYPPVKKLTSLYTTVQDALPAAERVFELLDADEEPADAPGARALGPIREGIRYRGVVFSYGREEVLRGVDLEIRAGESVALVGATGAGKTTVADLLLRFADPDAGGIEIDGVDLRELSRASLRENIAVVTQEPFLFDATILDNIRYARPDASFDEVVDAARAAHAHEFIEKLPDGYDTEVGELGGQLSGGQRQRVTIARALLRDPQILIFDEATSALDAKAEQIVQDAIWSLMRGRTVVVIAHRLSTVQAADRIAVLENGRVSEFGTHDELMAKGGLYRELVEIQLRAG